MLGDAEIPSVSRQGKSQFDALVAGGAGVLDAIPGAVYVCDEDGWVVIYNAEAAELWGSKPNLKVERARFCGSHRLYWPDGSPLPHAETPMADAVRTGMPTRNAEVFIERPDGSRIAALVNIRALFDGDGRIQGAINCIQNITKSKALEQEVVRQRDDLDDFFENSAVGLHIVSGDGTILRANKAELDLLGYAPEEYIGRPITEFHVDAPVIADILGRLSGGEKLDRCPARLRAKDGSTRHVLITSNGRFEDGKLVNTRCFTTDITGLREAEAKQRESDVRLAATYEAAPVGIAEVDRDGRYLRVNDALCQIMGRSREELLATSLIEVRDEEDRYREAELYQRQVSGELPSYTTQKRAIRSDGSLSHLDVFSSSVSDHDGRFLYAVRVMQDVTERRRMQDEIFASERRLREILEALPAAIYTTDAEGRITFFNRAATELAGREPQLGVDQWCVTWRLLWPDGTPMAHDDCPMAIALKEGRPVRGYEAIAERPDGSRIPFLPYPTPLLDAAGRVVGAVNMLVDITDRKEAETRQKGLIDELNHRVKNTLATVQSLAVHSGKHTSNVEDFLAAFQARVLALAKAHDLLTKRNWTAASLGSLVHDLIAPYRNGEGSVRIEGSPVELSPRAALSLTMVLNELATNAAKYGALSTPGGSLLVAWETAQDSDQTLSLRWFEQDVPNVVAPMRRGFGTTLIARCVEGELAGKAALAFEPGGLRCRIEVPLASLIE
ncbi:MAG: signal transduction histidine kinase [Rubritepida sp.]|nr:signal transduction histidine kinase [Rubritepida sp.]